MTRYKGITNKDGKIEWVFDGYGRGSSLPTKKNPTVDQYINEKGYIESPIDRSIHTTRTSYLNHIKQNNCEFYD